MLCKNHLKWRPLILIVFVTLSGQALGKCPINSEKTISSEYCFDGKFQSRLSISSDANASSFANSIELSPWWQITPSIIIEGKLIAKDRLLIYGDDRNSNVSSNEIESALVRLGNLGESGILFAIGKSFPVFASYFDTFSWGLDQSKDLTYMKPAPGFFFLTSDLESKLIEFSITQQSEDHTYRGNLFPLKSNAFSFRYSYDSNVLFKTRLQSSLSISDSETRRYSLGLLNINPEGKLTKLEWVRSHFISGDKTFRQTFRLEFVDAWENQQRWRMIYIDRRFIQKNLQIINDHKVSRFILSFGFEYTKGEIWENHNARFNLLTGVKAKF